MTNPLTLFFATLATGWLSVVVVGTKYYLEVGPAPDVVIERPPDPPPPPPSEAMNQFVISASYDIADAAAKTPRTVVVPPVSEEVSRLVSRAGRAVADAAATTVVIVPPPDALTRLAIEFGQAVVGAVVRIEPGRLTVGRVDFTKGDVIILVIGTHLTPAEVNALDTEVKALRNGTLKGRLVGDDVLVTDRIGVWRWEEWQARQPGERKPLAADKEQFGRLFRTVADDLDTVTKERARGGYKPPQRLVVWHSVAKYDEVAAADAAVRVPDAALIWSGAASAQQEKCEPVLRVFGEKKVAPHGPDILGVANTVDSFVR